MNAAQWQISLILLGALLLFAQGKLRYDVVALGALLLAAFCGLIPPDRVFSGFSHPAVITVAGVLVMSSAVEKAGVMEGLVSMLRPLHRFPSLQVFVLCACVALTSAVMNDVGALALYLPLALQLATRSQIAPSKLLIPISFSSLLGGLITMIGTPPNIIISGLRESYLGEPFAMFDFAPVGLIVAFGGIAYIAFVGRHWLPLRRPGLRDGDVKQTAAYIMELRLSAESRFANRAIYALTQSLEHELSVLALVRGERRILAPTQFERLQSGDVLVVEGATEAVNRLVKEGDFVLEDSGGQAFDLDSFTSERVEIVEVMIGAKSPLIGHSAQSARLKDYYGVNLLAIARGAQAIRQRLQRIIFNPGDVLLLQVEKDTLDSALNNLGCLPLAKRPIKLGKVKRRQQIRCLAIFLAAVLAVAVFKTPASLAFTSAVLVMILSKTISLREAYDAIDGSVLMLLACMLPVGMALADTGATAIIATHVLNLVASFPNWLIMAMILLLTMLLSDVINNSAAAIVMAPFAVEIGSRIAVPVDAMLMLVCVGASCTFLTPIGHQSNLLVMSPGGYRFHDYARVGWLLDLIVIALTIPALYMFWM